MKRAANYIGAFACLLFAGCASQMRATTDVDNGVDFSKFQTFGWIDPNPLIRTVTARPLSPLVQQRLMADTKEILGEQGLRFVENAAEAELAFAFTIGSREGIRVDNFPTTSFRGTRGRRSYTWGGNRGGSSVRTRTYTEGQLAVDMFSVAEARPVWHGTTSSRITRGDRAEPDAVIREALETILAEFPRPARRWSAV